MRRESISSARGFSLVEVMVAMALGLIVLGGAVLLFRQGADLTNTVTLRAEMQQNARAAMNLIARDLSIAGTGVAAGGIQLPSGSGSGDSMFGCDSASCYITSNVYADDRLYAITPGDGKGPTVNGVATDIVTLIFRDTSSNLDQLALTDVTPSGNQIRFDPGTTPPYDDPVVGLAAGDLLIMCNINGCAAGVVTSLGAGGRVNFANSDALNINQPSAAFGNITSLSDGPPTGYPTTYSFRILVLTYYIDATDPNAPRLMRQVNAHPPQPVAEYIENLQFSYDIYDEDTSVATADLPDAGSAPNQIRKVNLSVSARSHLQGLSGRGFERIILSSSVSPRNLSFRDRYE